MPYLTGYSKLLIVSVCKMLNQLPKNLILVLIVFFSFGWGQGDTTFVAPEVPLDVFGGVGSILLVWAVPETVTVHSATIYRALNPDSGFDSISDVEIGQSRYLDQAVEPNIHYFYRVEIFTENGRLLESSLVTPPFTRAAELEDSLAAQFSATPDSFYTVDDYFIDEILRQELLKLFPEIGSENQIKLQTMFAADQLEYQSWFDQFPLNDFSYFNSLGWISFADDFIKSLEREIDIHEIYLRNSFLLTPSEWQSKKMDFLLPLKEWTQPITDSYTAALLLLNRFDPVRIVSLAIDSSGYRQLELVYLQPGKIADSNVILTLDNISYPLTIDRKQVVGYRDTIQVPPEIQWVTLNADGILIQQFSTNCEFGFVCALNDEYVLTDSLHWDEKYLTYNPDKFYINELIFLLDDSRISVEVSGKADSTISLSLFMNDSLVIDLSYFNQEHEYQTYSWLTDNSLNSGWVSLVKKVNDSTWKIIESRPVDLTSNNFEARIPDGGPWIATSFGTLGDPNDLTRVRTAEIAIPEVFALYQNYPNPFNAKTTIAFDLLQSATISLFITDATGRKIDVFLEDIPSEPGNYQYSWDGHSYSSGVYFVTIQAQVDEFLPVTFSRKMIYLK